MRDDAMEYYRGRATIDGIQGSLLFTDKQSRKIYKWLCDAEKAVGRETPSKSARRLRSLRSKKQTLKEFKMQRKLTTKKKGRGGGK